MPALAPATIESSDVEDKQLDKRTTTGSLLIFDLTILKAVWISSGCGNGVYEFVWHQFKIADLRARFGIMVLKSTLFGLKDNDMHASTQLRSNVWPEETMTGSAMRLLDIGHMNSGGGGDGGDDSFEGDLRRLNLHLCLLVPM